MFISMTYTLFSKRGYEPLLSGLQKGSAHQLLLHLLQELIMLLGCILSSAVCRDRINALRSCENIATPLQT